jgi:hypothetical protein
VLLAALFLGLAALYWATRQGGFYGDGIYYVGMVREGIRAHGHVFYLPLFRAARWVAAALGGGGADLEVLQALAVVPAALCGPLLWLLCRAHAREPAPVLVAALALFAPGFWFFAGATELHALNAACCLAALVAQDRRGLLAPVTLVAWVLACGTHVTGILFGPTLLLLEARRNPAGPCGRISGFVACGALLLALALLPLGIGVVVDREPVLNYVSMLASYQPDGEVKSLLRYSIDEGPRRMGWLAALAPAGAVLLGRRDRLRAAAFVLPVVLYGVAAARTRAPELGAYFVPVYGCLAVLSAAGAGGSLALVVASLGAYAAGLATGAPVAFAGWLVLGAAAGLASAGAPDAERRMRAGRRVRARALVVALAGLQVVLGVAEARRMAAPSAADAVALSLARVTGPADRVFFYLSDFKMIGYAEYYLGDRFDGLMTNLATLEPDLDFHEDPRVGSVEAQEERMARLVSDTVRAGGRALFDRTFLPPGGGSTGERARRFVERMRRELGAVAVQGVGGSWWVAGWR